VRGVVTSAFLDGDHHHGVRLPHLQLLELEPWGAVPLLRALEVIESSGRAPIQVGATSLAASLRAGFEPLLRHLESES